MVTLVLKYISKVLQLLGIKRPGEWLRPKVSWVMRLFRLPDFTDEMVLQEMVYQIIDNRLKEIKGKEPELVKIVYEMKGEQVIFQKGEGPQVVKRDGETIVPLRGKMLMIKYFMAARIMLLRQMIGDAVGTSTFLDVGASSGLFLRELGKAGVGLNLSSGAVRNTVRNGVQAIQGNAESLPLKDKSFDYVLCFQTLEHLENPIKSLRELARVCREKIYLTIPRVTETKICNLSPEEQGQHQWHVFEFCPEDIRRVFGRVNLQISRETIIEVAGKPRNLSQRLFWLIGKDSGVFQPFQFYELVPPNL